MDELLETKDVLFGIMAVFICALFVCILTITMFFYLGGRSTVNSLYIGLCEGQQCVFLDVTGVDPILYGPTDASSAAAKLAVLNVLLEKDETE